MAISATKPPREGGIKILNECNSSGARATVLEKFHDQVADAETDPEHPLYVDWSVSVNAEGWTFVHLNAEEGVNFGSLLFHLERAPRHETPFFVSAV